MKNETKHTEGPWYTEGMDGLTIHRRTGERTYRFIALTDSKHDTGRTNDAQAAEDAANARLIASAPELLEAVKIAVKMLEERNCDPILLKCAIAKALGEQH